MRQMKIPRARSRCERLKKLKRHTHSIWFVMLVLVANSLGAAQQLIVGTSADGMDPSEIVWMMVARNETRARELTYFTALRHYHLDFQGARRNLTANMHVQVTYVAGSGKSFQVVDESGSRFLLNRVLRKLLTTEQADSREQKGALTPYNYNFVLDEETEEGGQRLYVFSVEPKKKNRLLYRGKIWIDAGDYAVVRVEAQPAESPSFWITRTEICHTYQEAGRFWLPQSNRSESKTRLGGTAVLTIDYGTYRFEPANESASESSEQAFSKLEQAVW
jgi:hypothetical protein